MGYGLCVLYVYVVYKWCMNCVSGMYVVCLGVWGTLCAVSGCHMCGESQWRSGLYVRRVCMCVGRSCVWCVCSISVCVMHVCHVQFVHIHE